MGGCAEECTQSAKPSSDPDRGQFVGVGSSFPWQAEVVDEASGEAELGVGANDQPGPSVGLFGCADRWCGPAQGSFGESVGVLYVESSEVGPPTAIEVGFTGTGPPQPERWCQAVTVTFP